MVPAALMGIDVARFLLRAQEMADACRLAEGNPGLELGLSLGEGWQAGRDKICIEPNDGRFRPLGRAAARGVDREARQGPDPGARRAGRRPRPAGAGGSRRAIRTSSARSSSAGSSRRRSPARSSGSIPSTSPTCRPRRTRPRRSSPPATIRSSSPKGRWRSSSRRRTTATTSASRRSSTRRRRPRRGWPRSRTRARQATGCVVTHGFGPALPALDRAAAQGRPGDGALSPGGRRHRCGARDPRQAVRVRAADPRPGGR